MNVSGVGGGMATQATSGASMRMSPTQKFSSLFDKIDTSGSGSIGKQQFEQAFASLKMPPRFRSEGAESVFSKLDNDGDDKVSKDDFITGMIGQMQAARTPAADATTGTPAADFQALLQGLAGATAGGSNASTASSASSSSRAAGLGSLVDVSV
jgi:hypothetical protein